MFIAKLIILAFLESDEMKNKKIFVLPKFTSLLKKKNPHKQEWFKKKNKTQQIKLSSL